MSQEFRQQVIELLPHKLKEEENAINLKKMLSIWADFIEQDRNKDRAYNLLLSMEDIEGTELDMYADMFSVYRETNEDDQSLRDRIILEIVLKKTGNSVPAIQQVINRYVGDGTVTLMENHSGRPASCYLVGHTVTEIFDFIFSFVRDLVPAGVRLFVPVALLGTWQDLWDAAGIWQNVASDRYIW